MVIQGRMLPTSLWHFGDASLWSLDHSGLHAALRFEAPLDRPHGFHGSSIHDFHLRMTFSSKCPSVSNGNFRILKYIRPYFVRIFPYISKCETWCWKFYLQNWAIDFGFSRYRSIFQHHGSHVESHHKNNHHPDPFYSALSTFVKYHY